MTQMARWCLGMALGMGLTAGAALGQEPPPQNPPPQNPPGQNPPPNDPARGRAGPRGGLRQGLPPVGPNMNVQDVQKFVDTWALIQAETVLQLSADQYPNFVARLARLHNVRRRLQGEKQRTMRELNALITAQEAPKDDTFLEKLKILDDLNQRGTQELRQALADLDAVLSPRQRARYRVFEEQIERKKVDLLTKIRPIGGTPPPPGPGRGR